MSKCAVVKIADGLVINIIIAEQSNLPPDGCNLINCDNMRCSIGWYWNGNEFIDPSPQVKVAVVKMSDFIVIDIIYAKLSDIPPENCMLVYCDNTPCEIGWYFDGINFIDPNKSVGALNGN